MLELADPTPPADRRANTPGRPQVEQARALMHAGTLARARGDAERARAFGRRSVAA
jgi:hypothetical protein